MVESWQDAGADPARLSRPQPEPLRRMNARPFKQIDVFTSVRYGGNALAVVFDADGIAAERMQRIAAWTNLSETAFVLAPTRPGASYRVRIFTPRTELPFAGHPSVGTAHALLEAGLVDASAPLLQECAAGLLAVRVENGGGARRVFVRAPRAEPRHVDAASVDAFCRALGAAPAAPPRLFYNGPDWLLVDLGDEAAVRALHPDLGAIAALSKTTQVTGVSVFGRSMSPDYAIVVRAFAPADGVPEDPVTGSANAAIGAYLRETGGLDAIGASYRASQGREVGRDGYVDVCVDATTGDVEIGGQSVTCMDGLILD
jgi:PhzF family phenazine biosynthesis protein